MIPASLSIDLDNAWAYRRAAGDGHWESTPSCLPLAIDRMIDVLRSLDLPITVFLVGRDLQCESDAAAIARLDELPSWEPANHSMNHLPWLHTMSPEQIEREVEQTESLIVSRLGRRPVGFRGPGFSCPAEVLRILARRGYRYDASVFPTSLAPVARMVFLMRSNLRGAERAKAKRLYGGFGNMRLPNRPHRRRVDRVAPGSAEIVEIPVTTMPFVRTPIHLSYVTFLAGYSSSLAKTYVRSAFAACDRFGVPPSLLLHPPDFLGRGDCDAIRDFPGMTISTDAKLSLTHWILQQYAARFDVRLMKDVADQVLASDRSLTTSSPALVHQAVR